MFPMPAKKKSKRSFGKGGKKPTINNPDTHHGTYDLPNASVRSYSEKAKPMKFAEGGSTTFAEEFKKARAKGAGTVFDWKGQKIAAYRAGEEPKSWKKGKEEPKKEAPKSESKPAPKPESKAAPPRPTTQAETNRTIAETALANARRMTQRREEEAMTPEQRMNRNQAEAALASARMIKPKDMEAAKRFSTLAGQGGPMAGYYREQAKKFAGETFAKGGTVESKSMMKKEIGFMQKKGAPKSMIKHEKAEAKGMKSGGMAGYKSGGSCGSGMKKYAGGGGVAPSGVRPGSPSASRINRGPTSGVMVSPAKYARGGGVESHGKTKGTMVKMASGGSVSARADGVASKGKTNCKIC